MLSCPGSADEGAEALASGSAVISGCGGLLNVYTVDNATLGAPADTPVMTLANVMPQTVYAPVGSFPVSTAKGEGYFGENALSTIYYLDKKSNPLPYYQRMMFNGAHDTFNIGYAGTQGRKGLNQTDINLPTYQTGWTYGGGVYDPTFNAARPNYSGRFSDIFAYRINLNSHYNALIVQYRHQFSRGYEITSNYTWSKTVSDYPVYDPLAGNGAPGGEFLGYGQALGGFVYPNLNSKGQSVQSHPQRFVFSGFWEPKYGESWSQWVKAPLTGWRLSGIMTMESGNTMTVANGGPGTPCPAADAGTPTCPTGYGSSAEDGAGFDELNVSENPNIGHFSKTPIRQFNTSAFSVPAMGVRGDSGLGSVRGPGQNNLDLSLAKTFPINERFHFEFRADAFNALNHTQWTGMNIAYPGGNPEFPFGMVNSTREARVGQIAAKLVF